MAPSLEDEVNRVCAQAGYGWIMSEDGRPGSQTPPVTLLPDGSFRTVISEVRWWSACAFTVPQKEVVAVTDEVHGGDEARDAVLRQLLQRLLDVTAP